MRVFFAKICIAESLINNYASIVLNDYHFSLQYALQYVNDGQTLTLEFLIFEGSNFQSII